MFFFFQFIFIWSYFQSSFIFLLSLFGTWEAGNANAEFLFFIFLSFFMNINLLSVYLIKQEAQQTEFVYITLLLYIYNPCKIFVNFLVFSSCFGIKKKH